MKDFRITFALVSLGPISPKAFLVAMILSTLSIQGVAGELPEKISLDRLTAESHGFVIEKVESGNKQEAIYRVTFPGALDDCRAGRVQVATLTDSGGQVAISSFDVPIHESTGSLLVAHDPFGFDQNVIVQYCCNGTACKLAYSIEELDKFSHGE